MKSTTSPTPSGLKKRVIKIAVSGKYSCRLDVIVPVRPDAEVSAAVMVEQGREDARGVKTRTAEPIDGSVGTDQGSCLQVADQAMVTNVWVAIHRNILSSQSGFRLPLLWTIGLLAVLVDCDPRTHATRALFAKSSLPS